MIVDVGGARIFALHALDQIQAVSVQNRIAIGPQAGRKALILYSVPPLEDSPHSVLLAQVAGFSLHAVARLSAPMSSPDGERGRRRRKGQVLLPVRKGQVISHEKKS